MLYHILGAISALLFILTWLGLWAQISNIYRHRKQNGSGTQSLSLNQFGSSFFAFYANFIFGISVEPFNHYLVWTRCGALLLTLFILWHIWQERHNKVTALTLLAATVALVAGFASITFRPFPVFAQLGANGLMLVVTLILIQGTYHQWLLLYKYKQIGALSFGLFRSILVKDISTLLFGLTMPLNQAWPLLVLNGASVIMRGAVLIQMEVIKRRNHCNVLQD
ncbi:MAG: hypothetical protein SWN10_19100 [Pseudomonadota bacterium]|jgi:uncharacterized protein with PQ loop repeat|uniref:Uncharacterized protein n=1 Tax=Alteromonas oceani TaxID=2071609 RepID=A0ABV7JTM6_9ALTE|nr:hypothetical protein [Alteromonas oceani]MDY6929200.1 hypothetical protein [Pseudomonadota bacterium]HCB18086.1 hypothetical protein [Alteromonas sp.]HCV19574.1 hypothetical protein [Alteromonas sp.]|tara:strand:- start:2582 stop:3250 length:669 start_codon:yes stop_codon:yes gene_type:complete